MASSTETSSGLSFTSVLTLIFIVLKLTDVIDWSWWWVLSPTLIGLAISAVLMVVLVCLKGRDW